MSDLCPFCGSDEIHPASDQISVSACGGCGATGPIGVNAVEGIALWETRADPWIPITDERRRPEEGQECVVTAVCRYKDSCLAKKIVRQATYYDHENGFDISAYDVISWQPLPPPYTGDT